MAVKKRDRKGEADEQTDSSGLTREEREEMIAGEDNSSQGSYSRNDDQNWRADDSPQ